MSIPYSNLPHYNELFTDYVENISNVSQFFKYDFKNFDQIAKCIEDKKHTFLKDADFDRNDLCDLLRTQNQDFHSSPATFENIQLLHYENTFAVVTGQQIGFLTGPLYTVIKAINTVQLCENFAKRFPEYNFVPVFWMEADDHDFLEINNINIINKSNELKNIKYFAKGIEEEKYLKPVGNIILDEFIKPFLNEIGDELQPSDFTKGIVNFAEASYSPGNTLKNAFAKFFNSLLGDFGIILIDPSDDDVKKFLKPVFVKELYSFPENCERVIDTSVELERNYFAQVKPQPINLFYIHNGNRYLIEPRDNDLFALKNSRQKFSKEELHSILDLHPEKFSWNVVTRPIVQDYLLPTIAYIGGPSEIAYFAQLGKVYDSFNLSMPVIYPRTSVTLIEHKTKNFLDKYEIPFSMLFEKDKLEKELLNKLEEKNAEALFAEMFDELNAIFYRYESELTGIDKQLVNTYKKKSEQYLDSLNVLKEKFTGSQLKQSEIISDQLRKNIEIIFPGNSYQERKLNMIYFINKYSFELIDYLKKAIKINEFAHQLINLDLHPQKHSGHEPPAEKKSSAAGEKEGTLFHST